MANNLCARVRVRACVCMRVPACACARARAGVGVTACACPHVCVEKRAGAYVRARAHAREVKGGAPSLNCVESAV
eukprot:2142373-Pleurochrysis_carterae.AAC.2